MPYFARITQSKVVQMGGLYEEIGKKQEFFE
jgi:hypothetical protein